MWLMMGTHGEQEPEILQGPSVALLTQPCTHPREVASTKKGACNDDLYYKLETFTKYVFRGIVES